MKLDKRIPRFFRRFRNIKIKNLALLTIAGLVNAFGVTVFLAPVNLYDSGVSGTSMLLAQITPDAFSLSLFLILLNVPLFLFGYKKQGFAFTVYAVYTVAIYSVGAFLITNVLPIDVVSSSPIAGKDLLLCALFGGIVSGMGSGLAIRFGGAMDGVEVMAVIFAKRIGITVGTFVMAYNAVLYVLCGILMQSWALPLYSIIAYMAGSKTVDYIVDGFDRSKSVMIVTAKAKEVCSALSVTFEQGMTILEARGYYSDSEKKVVYIVLNRFQIGKMKNLVHKIDPTAYLSISDVADVYKANQNTD